MIGTDNNCQCSNTTAPGTVENFSLTNYVELVKVDELDVPKHNRFEMVRQQFTPLTVRQVISAFNVFADGYDAYVVVATLADSFKIMPVLFTDPLRPKSTYFFVNQKFTVSRDVLQAKLYEIWRTRAGANKFGSVYEPSTPNRFPYIMPSRGVIFR
jgi:hypothetical protein